MSNLEPVPHKTLLNRIYPNGDIPVNFMNDTKNQKDDIMELNKNDDYMVFYHFYYVLI